MPERILVVEDDPAMREGLTFHLHRLGFDVQAAPDGASALDAIRDLHPDVLLLDLILPGDIDGIDVLRSAREVAPRVGAIVMTGHPSTETTVQALRLGAYDYVVKPFDLGAMSRVLSGLVQKLRQERQMAAATRELETISRCTRLAINALDPRGRFTHWGSERLLGYPAAEMVGRATPAAYVVSPGFDLQAELEACRREAGIVRERQVRHAAGQLLTVREEWVPLTDALGHHVGCTVHLTDVTEEQRLRAVRDRRIDALERRLDGQAQALAVMRALGQGIARRGSVQDLLAQSLPLILRAAGLRVAWCFLAGEDEELPQVYAVDRGARAPGMPSVEDVCPGEACECLLRLRGPTAALGPSLVACPRLRVLVPDLAAPVHLSLPLRAHDELLGVLNLGKERFGGFGADEIALLEMIANQLAASLATIQLDAKLDELLRELREQQRRTVQTEKLRAVGELASGVAHDFNNLLTAILGRAELLLHSETDPARATELRLIVRAAQDGGETARRILEFARVRAERDAVPVDLVQVVREAVELTRTRWRDSAQAAGASIQVHLDLAPAPLVAGHPAELREVFTNLILNAVDAMPRGGTLSLATRASSDPAPPGAVEVRVADSGVGIAAELVDRIFDPFFTTKDGSGSGLGLSITYGIVQRHGGDISVASTPGAGSTFTVRLPALPADAPAVMPAAPALAAPTPGARPVRILVVDDKPRLAELLRAFLEMEGHQVTTAIGGERAIALIGREPLDLILTDLGMPDVSGWEVACAARRLLPHTPVLLVSGWGAQISPEEVEAAGIAGVVQKPYTFESVRRALAAALAGGPAASA